MSALTTEIFNYMLTEIQENKSNYQVFVETGTLLGDTVINLKDQFTEIHTVEIAENYYNAFVNNRKLPHINAYLGDSVFVLPEIVKNISADKNVVFWLDGHHSAGDTGLGVKSCPLLEECAGIDQLLNSNRAIVIIDDYNLFGKDVAVDQDWTDISVDNILSQFHNFNVIVTREFGTKIVLVIERK